MTTEIVLEEEASSPEDAERAEFAKWKGASARTLQQIWDNDKDAVYDTPQEVDHDNHS